MNKAPVMPAIVPPATVSPTTVSPTTVSPTTVSPTTVFPPIVDLAGPGVPEAIDDACRRVGFFQVVGHGIPAAVLNEMFAAADGFFLQSVEEKGRWASPDPAIERGYSAKASESFAYSMDMDQPPDLMEGFTIGGDSYPPDDPIFHTTDHHFFEPNIWPDNQHRLRRAMLTYFDCARQLAHRLTSLFAEALGLPIDFFEERTDHSLDTLRINFFEGLPGEVPQANQLGTGAHTDYGIVTVLLADQTPGLEVLDPTGAWRAVLPAPGALLVNIGDLMAQWTNDRWRSTLHQVQPVTADGEQIRRRRSVPFFHEGNYDMTVACLPTCCSADNPAKYPPVHAGKHVQAKVLKGRLLTAAATTSTLGDRGSALS